ncbi:DoxX family protein [Mucilaginibacter ginsenosidivorans]|uniref:DoxX family protein n=1 Tax=Mucilaginibacter ginsenosidivorans TaxID=398053 RepID=A0A5B8USD0_9SPHI|nr:DoxX family protein [Mucilaginibacter ginsenosidivorans]QEC61879.1 DoxX family protein [Mucilaginibacter ginsenosidivorans]
MDIVHRIETWGDGHHPRFFDAVRIALGIFLMMKGIAFMQNISDLQYIMENQADISLPPAILIAVVYYAAFIHMAGGTLIALGIFTRLSCVLQLPVVFGAVFFVNLLLSPVNTELWASIVCLALLIVFMIIGSGKASLENFFKTIRN